MILNILCTYFRTEYLKSFIKQVLFTTPWCFEERSEHRAVGESGGAGDARDVRSERERREERLGRVRELRHSVGRPGLYRDQWLAAAASPAFSAVPLFFFQ